MRSRPESTEYRAGAEDVDRIAGVRRPGIRPGLAGVIAGGSPGAATGSFAGSCPKSDQPLPTFHLRFEVGQRPDEFFEMDKKVRLAKDLADLGQKIRDLRINKDVLRVRVEKHFAVDAAVEDE